MGTSALKVVTGVLDGKSIRNSISQASHGFSAGMAVRWDIDSAGFTTAIATSPQSAEVSGIIETVVDDDTFMLVYQGEIIMTNFTTGTDNIEEEVYFLSANDAGYLSPTPPTSGGHVIKPLLTRRGTVSGSSQQKGLVMNYLGTIIGGEATVSLDGLMPVGTINAYAGKSSDVPNGWGICDGGTIDAYRYAEYYTRVGWNYGSWQTFKINDLDTAVGSINGATITQTFLDGNIVNATILSWNNESKTIVVDNLTHDPATGEPITSLSNRKALFENTIASNDGHLTITAVDNNPRTATEVSVVAVKKPDLRARIPMGLGMDANNESYERGRFGGSVETEIGIDNMPYHDHALTVETGDIVIPNHSHNINTAPITTSQAGAIEGDVTGTQSSQGGNISLGALPPAATVSVFSSTPVDASGNAWPGLSIVADGTGNISGSGSASSAGSHSHTLTTTALTDIISSPPVNASGTGVNLEIVPDGTGNISGSGTLSIDEGGAHIHTQYNLNRASANDDNMGGAPHYFGISNRGLKYLLPSNIPQQLTIKSEGSQHTHTGSVTSIFTRSAIAGALKLNDDATTHRHKIEIPANELSNAISVQLGGSHTHTISPSFAKSAIAGALKLNDDATTHQHEVDISGNITSLYNLINNSPITVDGGDVTISLDVPHHSHIITANQLSSAVIVNSGGGLTLPIDDIITVTATGQGANVPINNLQPYLITNYIVRISSEAKAGIIDGMNIDLSMEGLSNVNDSLPSENEMIRYDSTGAEYEKFYPTIDGMGAKDNQDTVLHTSQGTDGTTLEALRLGTDGTVWIGMSAGTTLGTSLLTRDTLVVKNTKDENGSYVFMQGGENEQSGMTGARFGSLSNTTVIHNSCPYDNPSKNIGLYFNNSSDNAERHHRITPYGIAVGDKNAGASLDVMGDVGASGDIYTYGGGTHGMFANILGVSAASGGYNFPDVSSGVSGAVPMITSSGYTLEFHPFNFVQYWTSDDTGKGISFDNNVGVATGGVNDVYGATLEVGGGAIFHGAITADSLYVGANPTDNALISGLTSGKASMHLKSTAGDSEVWLDSTDQSNIVFKESGNNKTRLEWKNSDNDFSMQQYFNDGGGLGWQDIMKWDSSGRLAIGQGSSVNTNFAVSLGTGGEGLGVSADASLFASGMNDVSGHSTSKLQLFSEPACYMQFGNTLDADGANANNFSSTTGFLVGVSAGGHAEIHHAHPTGATIDFRVGTAYGASSVLSSQIRQDGLHEFKKGMIVKDGTASYGSSGDVLLNKDGTGELEWSSGQHMPMPTNTIGAVGQVIPLFISINKSNQNSLPGGAEGASYLVSLSANENGNSTDEDVSMRVYKVFNVPANNYLRFKNSSVGYTGTNTWKSLLVSNSTNTTASGGNWVHFDNTTAEGSPSGNEVDPSCSPTEIDDSYATSGDDGGLIYAGDTNNTTKLANGFAMKLT